MKKPYFSEIFIWDHNRYKVDVYNSTNFDKLKKIEQVYGFIFDNGGKILLVNINNKWGLPGGTPETYDANWKETLKREVLEEADVEIENIIPGFYLIFKGLDNKKAIKGIAVRCIANVKSVKSRTIDPATNKINKRKFVSKDQFIKSCHWGKNGEIQLKLALKKYQNSLKVKK